MAFSEIVGRSHRVIPNVGAVKHLGASVQCGCWYPAVEGWDGYAEVVGDVSGCCAGE